MEQIQRTEPDAAIVMRDVFRESMDAEDLTSGTDGKFYTFTDKINGMTYVIARQEDFPGENLQDEVTRQIKSYESSGKDVQMMIDVIRMGTIGFTYQTRHERSREKAIRRPNTNGQVRILR